MNRRSFASLLSLGALSCATQAREKGVTIIPTSVQKDIILPQKLSVGSRIGLIAPGSAINQEKLTRALANVRSLGMEPVLGEHIMEQNGYLAGTDAERLADLHAMFGREDIDGIWCIRGGYGCTRLLDYIDYGLVLKNPKILLGYSDITALHLAIYKETGLVTFHGPVASSPLTPYNEVCLSSLLYDPDTRHIEHQHVQDTEAPFRILADGKAKGTLLGGNLSLLAAMAGTRWSPDFSGCIVFLEDVGEKPYLIDRMLVQLRQACNLDNAAGIVLGRFADCDAEGDPSSLSLYDTLAAQLSIRDRPIVMNFSFGHVDDICTLPVGVSVELDTASETIALLQPCVE